MLLLELVIGLGEIASFSHHTNPSSVHSSVFSCLSYHEAALGLGDIQQAVGRGDVAQDTGNWVGGFSATAQPWFAWGDVCVCECTCTGLSVRWQGDTQEHPVAHGQDQFKLVSHKLSIKEFCITCLKTLTLMLRHGFYVQILISGL